MDHQLHEQIANHLDSDEQLRWVGRPKTGIRFRLADLYLIPFSLLWAGFAVFWEWGVFKGGGPPFMLLFGGAFVIVGIYIVVGRFFYDALRRRSTLYAVTNRRVIIVIRLISDSVKSFDIGSLTNVSVTEGGNGFGDILLGPASSDRWAGGSGWPGSGSRQAPTLEWVPKARAVFQEISNARADQREQYQHD